MGYLQSTEFRAPFRPACEHKLATPRLMVGVNAGGARNYYAECPGCQRRGSAIARAMLSPEERKEAENHVEILADQRAEQDVARMERFAEAAQERANESAEWWARYNEYMASPEWNAKRQIVLKRDQYTCQACLAHRAVQVHHTTYKHVGKCTPALWGQEPLFDLVSVCIRCHDLITKMDRAAKTPMELGKSA